MRGVHGLPPAATVAKQREQTRHSLWSNRLIEAGTFGSLLPRWRAPHKSAPSRVVSLGVALSPWVNT